MCKWCGLLIYRSDGRIDRTKRFCGPLCATQFNLRADPQKMREHVFFRDGGKCARCGTVHDSLHGAWEMDHVLPLMLALGLPSFWDEENCCVLCIEPCHKLKSGEDRRKYRLKYRRKAKAIFDEISD